MRPAKIDILKCDGQTDKLSDSGEMLTMYQSASLCRASLGGWGKGGGTEFKFFGNKIVNINYAAECKC